MLRFLEYDASPLSPLLTYVQAHQPDAVIGLIFQKVPKRLILENFVGAFPATQTNLPRFSSQPSNSLMTMARSPCLQRAIRISFLAASPNGRGSNMDQIPLDACTDVSIRRHQCKKPSERRADASAWLPLRVTFAFAIHLARRGRLAWASPNSECRSIVSVQCVLVNEKASKTLLFCCRYATSFHMNF